MIGSIIIFMCGVLCGAALMCLLQVERTVRREKEEREEETQGHS